MSNLPPEIELNYLHSPQFDARLEWLLDKQPDLVRELFQGNKEELKDNLLLGVEKAMDLFSALVDSGMDNELAHEREYQEALCPPNVPREGRPLSEAFKKKFRAWSLQLLEEPEEKMKDIA